MAIKIDGTGVLTFNDNSTQTTAFDTRLTVRRNLIMNPLYLINQRNSTAQNISGGYTVDRWLIDTGTQSTSVEVMENAALSPSLYTSRYLRVRANTVIASPTGANYGALCQNIEGVTIAPYNLQWGTAQAKPLTLTFRASASSAGTMSVALRAVSGSGVYRSYVAMVDLTTTPQTFTVSIPGDVSNTALPQGAATAFSLFFNLYSGTTFASSTKNAWVAGNYVSGTGQTNWQGTASAEIRISDVQLEVGTVATPLEWLPHQEELVRCMRYMQGLPYGTIGRAALDNLWVAWLTCQIPLRATPTVKVASSSATVDNSNSAINTSTLSVSSNAMTPSGGRIAFNGFTSLGAGNMWSWASPSNVVWLDAEI